MNAKEMLAEARAITDASEKAGRTLTTEEKQKVERILAAVQRAKDDEEMQRQIDGGLFGGPPGAADFHAKFAANWNAAVIRFKDATITGDLSLPVGGPPVQIPTEPTVAGLFAQANLDDSDKFSYLKEGVHTIGAAPVAKGGTKPSTDVAVSREEGNVEQIAHVIDAINRADLDDESFLGDLINKVGREGLLAELDDQVLNGSGVTPQLTGLLNDGDVQNTPFFSDILTTLREGKKDLRLVNVVPTAVLVHPDDAAALDELRDAEQFLIGNAGTPDAPWGVRRVETTKIASGTALMGDFLQARLYSRGPISILADPYSGLAGTNMQKNRVDFRFESRYGLAVLRGQAFTIIDLTAGS